MTIKEIRSLTKLSQANFGKLYGIPTRTIENWESGKSKCPDYVMDLLERAVKEDYIGGRKMIIYTACKETGDFIETVNSIKDGLKLIESYEERDRLDDVYEEDFYDIVDENHCSLI